MLHKFINIFRHDIQAWGLGLCRCVCQQRAKDVTQRYVGSVLAADKLRDNAWWEQDSEAFAQA